MITIATLAKSVDAAIAAFNAVKAERDSLKEQLAQAQAAVAGFAQADVDALESKLDTAFGGATVTPASPPPPAPVQVPDPGTSVPLPPTA